MFSWGVEGSTFTEKIEIHSPGDAASKSRLAQFSAKLSDAQFQGDFSKSDPMTNVFQLPFLSIIKPRTVVHFVKTKDSSNCY